MSPLNCFEPTCVRGKIGSQLNAKMPYRIGRAFADYLFAQTVVIGGDNRLSTADLPCNRLISSIVTTVAPKYPKTVIIK